jgi:hypothetical protein
MDWLSYVDSFNKGSKCYGCMWCLALSRSPALPRAVLVPKAQIAASYVSDRGSRPETPIKAVDTAL